MSSKKRAAAVAAAAAVRDDEEDELSSSMSSSGGSDNESSSSSKKRKSKPTKKRVKRSREEITPSSEKKEKNKNKKGESTDESKPKQTKRKPKSPESAAAATATTETKEKKQRKRKVTPDAMSVPDSEILEAENASGFNTHYLTLYRKGDGGYGSRANGVKELVSAKKVVQALTPGLLNAIKSKNSSAPQPNATLDVKSLDLDEAFEGIKSVLFAKDAADPNADADGDDDDDVQRLFSVKRLLTGISQLAGTPYTKTDVNAMKNRARKAKQIVGEYFMDNPGHATFPALGKDSVPSTGVITSNSTKAALDLRLGKAIKKIQECENDKLTKNLHLDPMKWKVSDIDTILTTLYAINELTLREEIMNAAKDRTSLPPLKYSDLKVIEKDLKDAQSLAKSSRGLLLAAHILKYYDEKYPSNSRSRTLGAAGASTKKKPQQQPRKKKETKNSTAAATTATPVTKKEDEEEKKKTNARSKGEATVNNQEEESTFANSLGDDADNTNNNEELANGNSGEEEEDAGSGEEEEEEEEEEEGNNNKSEKMDVSKTVLPSEMETDDDDEEDEESSNEAEIPPAKRAKLASSASTKEDETEEDATVHLPILI